MTKMLIVLVMVLANTNIFSFASESNPRVKNIHHLIHSYKKYHGGQALQNDHKDQFCSRKFINAGSSCQNLIGNNIGWFINAWGLALIINQTIVVTAEEGCDMYLKLKT